MADTNNNNLTRQMHDSVVPVTGNDMTGIGVNYIADEILKNAVDNIQKSSSGYGVNVPLVKPDTSIRDRINGIDTSFGGGLEKLRGSGMPDDPRSRDAKTKSELDTILKKIHL